MLKKSSAGIFFAGLICIFLSLFLHFQKAFDFFFQRPLFLNGSWIFNDETLWYHLFFYQFAKKIPWILAVPLVVFLAVQIRRKNKYKIKIGVGVLAYLAVLPILVNILKAMTGQFCPYDLQSFGGPHPDQTLYFHGSRCYPAGHTSAGFALMGLGFLISSTSIRRIFFILAFLWGSILGLYQMARGAHFLSDTLATQGLALILLYILGAWLKDEKYISKV